MKRIIASVLYIAFLVFVPCVGAVELPGLDGVPCTRAESVGMSSDNCRLIPVLSLEYLAMDVERMIESS